jgi:hypothetical protein
MMLMMAVVKMNVMVLMVCMLLSGIGRCRLLSSILFRQCADDPHTSLLLLVLLMQHVLHLLLLEHVVRGRRMLSILRRLRWDVERSGVGHNV